MRRLARPLLYVGTLGIVLGLARYHAEFIGHYTFHTSQRVPWTIAYAVILCVAAYGAGLPDLERRRSAWAPAVGAAVAGSAVISVLQLATGSLLLPRFVVFSSALLACPWFAICVGLADIGRSREEGRDRIVVVAGPAERAALELEMDGHLERPALLVGALSPREAHSPHQNARPLIDAVLESRATVLVLDRTASLDDTIVAQAATLHEAGLRVRSLSLFYDEWLGKLPVSELERMSLMFDVGELQRVRYGRTKRLGDLAVGVLGVAAFILAIPFVAAGNLVANRGPLFFRQTRVGRLNHTFEMVKFRTMRPDTGASDWTAAEDDRITPWGRVMRRSHIDELPQMINIVRGEQSVVGPRPEQPKYVAELRTKIPFYDLRHIVRPGLTGWAQVKYRYGASEIDALEKLQYEFYYLRHQSFMLDVRIVGRTIRSVLGWHGR
jgi:lipopolysaccharide/colanic/teichoic acid biosynthesis glycosyltransferase